MATEFTILTGENGHRPPKLAALKNGGFIAVWQVPDDGWSYGIKAQLVDGYGNLVGSPFLVNSEIILFDQMNPSVTTLSDGRILVTWDDNSGQGGDPDTNYFSVRGR